MTTWRRYLALGAASMAFGLLCVYAFTILIDPFGRLGIYKSADINFSVEERPSMVSRALDPHFNSAIIGNSTSIPLMPSNLDKITGLKFVSLSISGSDAPASIATLRFFLAHHTSPRVVVIALLPEIWCAPTFTEEHPFPFWLYSNLARYLFDLAKNTSFELLKTTLLDRRKLQEADYHPYIGADGYHTLIGPFDQPNYTVPSLIRARLDAETRPTTSTNTGLRFPALDKLAEVITKPSSAFYVVLWTPRYLSYAPVPGSAADRTDLACKSKLKAETSSLSNLKIVDWSSADRPENDDPVNFIDPIHYRRPLAADIEESIAESLPVDLKGP